MSKTKNRIGKQKPSFEIKPKKLNPQGGDGAIALAAELGLILDPWQEDIIRCWLSGKWNKNHVNVK